MTVANIKAPISVTRYQWFFALFTASVLLALGYALMSIGSSGTSLMVLAGLLAAFSSHNYFLAPALRDTSKASPTERLMSLGTFSEKQENVL